MSWDICSQTSLNLNFEMSDVFNLYHVFRHFSRRPAWPASPLSLLFTTSTRLGRFGFIYMVIWWEFMLNCFSYGDMLSFHMAICWVYVKFIFIRMATCWVYVKLRQKHVESLCSVKTYNLHFRNKGLRTCLLHTPREHLHLLTFNLIFNLELLIFHLKTIFFLNWAEI